MVVRRGMLLDVRNGLTRTIEVSDATFQKLAFAARVTGKAVGDLVGELVDAEGSSGAAPAMPATSVPPGQLPIFKIYRGRRYDGFYDPRNEAVTLVTGPFGGQVFRTPTAAAVAIVRHANPSRENAETNGFRFFKTADGVLLDSIRRR